MKFRAPGYKITFHGVGCPEHSRKGGRSEKCMEKTGASLIGEELVGPESRIALRMVDRATGVIAVSDGI